MANHPRRSFLKAAGLAIASLALPVKSLVGSARPSPNSFIVPIRTDVQLEIVARGPREGVVPSQAFALLGHLNSRPIWGFEPGTLLYVAMNHDPGDDRQPGIVVPCGTWHTFLHRDRASWDAIGKFPHGDMNALYPDGDIPEKLKVTARTDSYPETGRGGRATLGRVTSTKIYLRS